LPNVRDTDAAASAIGRDDDLAARVRSRVRKVADTLAEAAGDDDVMRRKFGKLPAGYEEVLSAAARSLSDSAARR
jgi:hypothetical protein